MLKKISFLIILGFIAFQTACSNQGYSVLASTGTVIGVEVSENPATQFPQAKLGYNRAELAFVPSNRNGEKNPATSYGNGAKDVADVLMELRYGGIFDTGASSGIYQRLAVGAEAVQQPGASVMFAKNADGALDKDAEAALKAVNSLPSNSETNDHLMSPMAVRYNSFKNALDTASMTKFDNAVKSIDPKYSNFGVFFNDREVTTENIKKVCDLLNSQGESFSCN